MKYDLNIKEVMLYYDIKEDGQVYSIFKRKYLKPQMNSCGYIYYFISTPSTKRFIFAHTLVAYKYLGKPKSLKYEIDHKDANKGNNHYTNLRWITHSENILRSYKEQGRVSYNKGRSKPSPGLETRMKMANAKYKKIEVYKDGELYTVFNSIGLLCDGFNIYRKKFNRIMNITNGAYNEYIFKYANEL